MKKGGRALSIGVGHEEIKFNRWSYENCLLCEENIIYRLKQPNEMTFTQERKIFSVI
jgi:hypothetical protein